MAFKKKRFLNFPECLAKTINYNNNNNNKVKQLYYINHHTTPDSLVPKE